MAYEVYISTYEKLRKQMLILEAIRKKQAQVNNLRATKTTNRDRVFRFKEK